MTDLRRHRLFARWVLAWFALVFVGSPVVTPMAHPQRFELREICLASGGMALVMTDLALASGMDEHGLHCPLCLPTLPTSSVALGVDPVSAAIAVVVRAAEQRIARATSPVLPARGPPAFS